MFDLNSIRLIAMVGFAGFTIAVVMLWSLVPQERSLRDWVIATMLLAASMLLLGLRGVIPDFISITIANTMVMLGVGYIYVGTRNLLGVSTNNFRWIWFATVATFFIGFSDDLSFRLPAYALLDAPFLGFCAWLFWRAKGDRQIVVVQRISALIFAVGALIFLSRVFHSPPTSAPSINIIAPYWFEVIPYVYAIMFSMWLSITLLLIVSFRLQNQREDALAALNATNRSLVENEYRFRDLFENTPFSYLSLDIEGKFIDVNKQLCELLGYSREELIGKDFSEAWVDELKADFQDRFNECKSCGSISTELMLQKKNGQHIPVLLNARIQYAIDGAFVKAHCVIVDISEQKRVEEEHRIAATVFESQEGMMVTDPKGIILRVNHSFSKISGYDSDEVVGQTPNLLSSGNQRKEFFAAMWASIQNTGTWGGEIWNRRKNGEVYPQQLTITAVKDGAGIITNYVATFVDITESKAAAEAIKTLAFYDPLTHLPNRRLLIDRLGQTMATTKRSKAYGALMFLDLDNFKPLNDTHGHAVGDMLLIEAAERLTSSIREMDTVARFGGDEFVVMLAELDEVQTASIAQAAVVAEKIRSALFEPYVLTITHDAQADTTVQHCCSVSIGVVMFIGYESSRDDIMKWADAAMYEAKEAGRNQIRFYGEQG